MLPHSSATREGTFKIRPQFSINKHCEVLVSCSGRKIDNFRNLVIYVIVLPLRNFSMEKRNQEILLEIEFSIIVV